MIYFFILYTFHIFIHKKMHIIYVLYCIILYNTNIFYALLCILCVIYLIFVYVIKFFLGGLLFLIRLWEYILGYATRNPLGIPPWTCSPLATYPKNIDLFWKYTIFEITHFNSDLGIESFLRMKITSLYNDNNNELIMVIFCK